MAILRAGGDPRHPGGEASRGGGEASLYAVIESRGGTSSGVSSSAGSCRYCGPYRQDDLRRLVGEKGAPQAGLLIPRLRRGLKKLVDPLVDAVFEFVPQQPPQISPP